MALKYLKAHIILVGRGPQALSPKSKGMTIIVLIEEVNLKHKCDLLWQLIPCRVRHRQKPGARMMALSDFRRTPLDKPPGKSFLSGKARHCLYLPRGWVLVCLTLSVADPIPNSESSGRKGVGEAALISREVLSPGGQMHRCPALCFLESFLGSRKRPLPIPRVRVTCPWGWRSFHTPGRCMGPDL